MFQSTYPDVQLMLHTGASASTAPLEPGVDLAITIDEPVEVPQLLVQKNPQRTHGGSRLCRARDARTEENICSGDF
jgi:DNA-binding transcriptional LysR family regulator